LKNAAFAGDKFTAAYEPGGEWSLGAKDQPSSPAVASGTWKIAKP
jgi:hypothetical protein